MVKTDAPDMLGGDLREVIYVDHFGWFAAALAVLTSLAKFALCIFIIGVSLSFFLRSPAASGSQRT